MGKPPHYSLENNGEKNKNATNSCKEDTKNSLNVRRAEEKESCLLPIASFFPLIRRRRVRRMMDRTKWIRDVSQVAGMTQVYFSYVCDMSRAYIPFI